MKPAFIRRTYALHVVNSRAPRSCTTHARAAGEETSFHQDLNGDGVIGIPTTVIESLGSTSLTQVGTNYYLYSGSVGPELTPASFT